MTNLTRWKLACALFAGIAGYGVVSAHRAKGHNAPAAQVVVPQGGTVPFALRRPIRVAPETLGISQRELVDRIEHARNAKDISLLCDRLAVIGDDEAVDALTPMLGDPRRGVPEALIGTFGTIGTQHAIDVVIEHANDERPALRMASIGALGSTTSQKAEATLLALVDRPADPMRNTAIAALGSMGTDNAVTKLIELASAPDVEASNVAIAALGRASSNTAQQALRRLVESNDPRVVAAALAGVDTIDDGLRGKLETLLHSGDVQVASSALEALGHVGEDALPIIREATRAGNQQLRYEAVGVIAQIGGDKAIEMLSDMLKDGDSNLSRLAAGQLVAMGGSAREALIEAAMSERGVSNGALEQLQQLQGDDVDNALLAVVKQGTAAEKKAALPRLVKLGNPEAIALATDLAQKGSTQDRYQAMQMLATAGTPQTIDAVIALAAKQRGTLKIQGLELVSRARPHDPQVTQLLADSLTSGRRDEAQYAAGVLARMGGSDAQHALLAALNGKDKALAQAVAQNMGSMVSDETVKAALLSAGQTNPEIKATLMTQLVNNGSPDGMKLAEELLAGKDPSAAQQAVWALANQSTPEAKALIARAIDSKDPNVRQAAIGTLARDPDDKSLDTLTNLARSQDSQTKQAALSALGQIGDERAQAVLVDAARSGKSEDRVQAISSLGMIDDPRVSAQIAAMMRDPDPQVASAAISSSYNGGPEVDATLSQIVVDPSANEQMKMIAAMQLRNRNTDMDPSTQAVVEKLTSEMYGGATYGRDEYSVE